MWDDVEEETPPQPEPAPEAAAAADGAGDGSGAGANAEAKPEEAEPPPPEQPTDGTEPRRNVYKYWTRPRFLQYNCIYDYQKSYYDDLIEYLDRRNKGLRAEIPRAQTWAERALRTYLANTPTTYTAKAANEDRHLLRHISTSARFQRYHTKALISRKYSHLGLSTVLL